MQATTTVSYIAAESKGRATIDRGERGIIIVLLLLTLGLRLIYVWHYRVDSDEPQHLHVAWAWTQGLLQYRDVFDNHAPLFHLLVAPVVALCGERADILTIMRLVMLPLYMVTVYATATIARALFSTRVAWWTGILAALAPAFFLTSVEFRTDNLWAAAFLAALAIAVGGRITRTRCFATGLLLGVALGVSMKSSLLLVATGFAAVSVTVLSSGGASPSRWREIATDSVALLAGLSIVPLALVGFFVTHEALGPFLYGTVWHNALPGLGIWHQSPGRPLLVPVAIPILLLATRALIRLGPTRAVALRRAFVFLVAAVYVVVLVGIWPLITAEDWLPVAPLVPLVGAGLLDLRRRVSSGHDGRLHFARALAAVAVACEVVITLGLSPPWKDGTVFERNLLTTVLHLTKPGEYVMDAKGEMVFRRRAYYWVLERITNERLERGLIRDTVPERLIATRTAVVALDANRFPPRARAFMRANYVSVGYLRVLGHWIRAFAQAGPARPIDFEVVVPERYAIVGTKGAVVGTLDGRAYDGPRYLTKGRHRLRTETDDAGPLAVVWERAVLSGFVPVLPSGT